MIAGIPPSRRNPVAIITAILAVAILIPTLIGFSMKFMELIEVFRSTQDGAFAFMPIVNYLLASTGFLLLLLWAIAQGMFRDIEAPKYTMLEQERILDEAAGEKQE